MYWEKCISECFLAGYLEIGEIGQDRVTFDPCKSAKTYFSFIPYSKGAMNDNLISPYQRFLPR